MIRMITLSWWEQFIVGATLSLLTMLESKITNPTEKAAIEAVITFLRRLLGMGVKLN